MQILAEEMARRECCGEMTKVIESNQRIPSARMSIRLLWWATIFRFPTLHWWASRAISITSSWPSADGSEIKFIVADGCTRLQWVAGGENGVETRREHCGDDESPETLFLVCLVGLPILLSVSLSIGLSAIKLQARPARSTSVRNFSSLPQQQHRRVYQHTYQLCGLKSRLKCSELCDAKQPLWPAMCGLIIKATGKGLPFKCKLKKSWLSSWLANELIPKPSPTSPSIAPTSNPGNQQKKEDEENMLQLATICGRWNILQLEKEKFSFHNRHTTHTHLPRRETTTRESLFAFFRTYIPHGKKCSWRKTFYFPFAPTTFFSSRLSVSFWCFENRKKCVCVKWKAFFPWAVTCCYKLRDKPTCECKNLENLGGQP